MFHKYVLACLTTVMLTTAGFGADLFLVTIQNHQEADRLKASGVDALLRVQNGYLVLTDQAAADHLASVGLKVEPVAKNVTRQQLALENYRDMSKTAPLPVIFQEDGVRLYRIGAPSDLARPDGSSLIPVPAKPAPIIYREPLVLNTAAVSQVQDLRPLIDQIRQDSLQSYLNKLQSFPGRVAATPGNLAARDWIRSKLQSFGYTATLEPFSAYVFGIWETCYNVVAVKTGTVFPKRKIVIGAHHDAVPGSPGADDNGTGTAGVLEMARVLADEPAEMTFVFALFDSEEQGLNGSWAYASNAYYSGDSIVCMVNMDMIGSVGNDTEANIKYGPETAYARLWIMLSDTLVGITGIMAGGASNSDHYPFVQNGFDVVYAEERVMSPYYHYPTDSTTHVNFDYFTRMVKGTLATAYTINFAPPGATVTSVRDGGDGQSLQAEWTFPGGTGINFFRVYFQPVPSGLLDSVTVPVGTTATLLTGLTDGQQYKVHVVAFDGDGHSSVVYNEVLGTPHIIPAAPANLRVMPAYRSIKLNWKKNNTELDFEHFTIIRDGIALPMAVTDTFYLDNDFSLGSDLHGYIVVARDRDGNYSDTVGVQPVVMRAATLQPGHILAVNRSGKPAADLVNEVVTGEYMREALTGYNYDYYSDTAYGSIHRTDTLHLIDLLDYEVVVFGGESARTDNFGVEPIFGGIMDTIGYYLSIGGKVVLFGRWGELYTGGIYYADTIEFNPGYPNYGYKSYFHLDRRIRYLSGYNSTTLNSDLIGAHSQKLEFPDLAWDSLASVNHSAPWTQVGGIPCVTFGVLRSGPEILYTYDSRTNFAFTEGRPIAWRYMGSDYKYIFFEFPLSFIQRSSAVAVLREAVSELVSPGIAAMTLIDPGTIDISGSPPATITIYVGDFVGGKTAGDVDQPTVRINGTVLPLASTIEPSVPPFTGDVLVLTVSTGSFLATYDPILGYNERTYSVSWTYSGEGESNLIEGQVVLINEAYLRGDANGDGNINVGDPVFIVGYVFRGGPAPDPLEAGDANCDAKINVGDAVYLVSYIFRGGPPPGCK